MDVVSHTISILIASRYDEDQKSIVNILTMQKDFCITGIEKDETGVIIKAERLKPNVLILDLQLSEIDGPDLVRIIHRRSPSTAIIILYENNIINTRFYHDEYHLSHAYRTGIFGFLVKEKINTELVPVVKLVSLGGYYFNEPIKEKVFNSIPNYFLMQEKLKNQIAFTPVERSIITDIINGISDTQIAKRLNYSIGTIKNCLTSLKRKVKLKNRTQIAVFSLIHGHIRLDQLDILNNHRQFSNDRIQ